MHNQEQDATCNKYARFTTEELLSIFKVEAQHICKKFDEVHSIAVSTLNDFIRYYTNFKPLTGKGETLNIQTKSKQSALPFLNLT